MNKQMLIEEVEGLFNQAIYRAHQGQINGPVVCKDEAIRLLGLYIPDSGLEAELQALSYELGYREGHVIAVDLAHIPALG